MRRARRTLLRLAAFLLPAMLLSGCFVYVHDACDACRPATLIVRNDPYAYGNIWYAYAVPSYDESWGEDLLDDAVLYPGDELIVDVYTCDRYYDLRAEYDHGLIIEKEGIWLPCGMTTVVSFID